MFKKFILVLLIILFNTSILYASSHTREKVIFISVATQTEIFWNNIHRLAKAAAKDLNVDLEIIYTNRNHIKAVEIAKEIAKRKNKPDYVIVVGEKLIASRSIPALSSSGIKVFLYGDLTKEELEIIGEPREKYSNYIGKIAIDDYMAGYLTAEHMVTKAIKQKLQDINGYINFFAFEGVRKTSFSSERVRGLNDVLKKYPEVRIIQSIATDWTPKYVEFALPRLLSRYLKCQVAGIWGANSALARTSSQILIEKGLYPS